MGPWTGKPAKQRWDAFFNPAWNVAVTQGNNGAWVSRDIISKTRRGWILSPETHPIDLDTDTFLPTDVSYKASGSIYITDPIEASAPTDDSTTKSPRTWEEYVYSLPHRERDFLAFNQETMNPKGLCAHLIDQRSTIIAVSDGACSGQFGSYSWVIGTTTENLWEGTGIARGQPMSAYRAEAYGKLSWLLFLLHYSKFMGMEIKCVIQSYCDNIQIVRHTHLGKTGRNSDFTRPDYDAIQQIRSVQEAISVIKGRLHPTLHVKGHQDRAIPPGGLSRQAMMNIRADSLAKNTLRVITGNVPTVFLNYQHAKYTY